jgi:hypothetical protein
MAADDDHGRDRPIGAPWNTFTAAQLDSAATRRELTQLVDGLVGALASRDERIKKLQDRLDAIEESSTKFCGVHQRALAYKRGSLVTCDGSLWAAVRDTHADERPGTGSTGWQLAVKQGMVRR